MMLMQYLGLETRWFNDTAITQLKNNHLQYNDSYTV